LTNRGFAGIMPKPYIFLFDKHEYLGYNPAKVVWNCLDILFGYGDRWFGITSRYDINAPLPTILHFTPL
jgi:hypothetical protein